MKRRDIIENPADLFTGTCYTPSGFPAYMSFGNGSLWPL